MVMTGGHLQAGEPSDPDVKELATHAVVYLGPGQKGWGGGPDPTIIDDTDAVVRVEAATICGTDLHISKATDADGDRQGGQQRVQQRTGQGDVDDEDGDR
jgi:hypothetical protein